MKPIHALAPGDALRCPHGRRWHGLQLNNVRDATIKGSRLSASCCACATAASFIGRQSMNRSTVTPAYRNLASPAIVSPSSELFERMEKRGPRDLPAEIQSGVCRVAEMPAKTHT
jgi:hypothetical protein